MSVTSDITQVDGRIHSKLAAEDKPLSSYTLKKYPWRPYVTPFEEIIGKKYPGSGTNEDPYIVDWLPNDREDPQSWSGTYKWFTVSLKCTTTMVANQEADLLRRFSLSVR